MEKRLITKHLEVQLKELGMLNPEKSSFIHSTYKYMLGSSSEAGIVPGAGDMEINRTDMASVPMEPTVNVMVTVSACRCLKGPQGRENGRVLCRSRRQSWDCCVEALVGRLPA